MAIDKQLFHGGNPVLDWMIGNVVIVQNRDGQVRPDKSKSTNKIDGVVSSLIAVGSWLYPEVETITEIRGLK
jgi:phage terminase large subunit-like protein